MLHVALFGARITTQAPSCQVSLRVGDSRSELHCLVSGPTALAAQRGMDKPTHDLGKTDIDGVITASQLLHKRTVVNDDPCLLGRY